MIGSSCSNFELFVKNKMHALLFAALATIVVASCNAHITPKISANANDFVDQVLYNMRPEFIEKNADPARLPEMDLNFTYNILGEHLGQLNLSDGLLIGLSTIERKRSVGRAEDNWQISYDLGILLLQGKMTVDQILLDANYSLHAPPINHAMGNLKADIRAFSIELHVMCDTVATTFELQSFNIEANGDITIKMDGTGGVTDAILNTIIGAVKSVFKDRIIGSIKTQIETFLREFLDSIQILHPIPPSEILRNLRNLKIAL